MLEFPVVISRFLITMQHGIICHKISNPRRIFDDSLRFMRSIDQFTDTDSQVAHQVL